jgi:hypothetical protein
VETIDRLPSVSAKFSAAIFNVIDFYNTTKLPITNDGKI